MEGHRKEHTSASTATLLTDDECDKMMAQTEHSAANCDAADTTSVASETSTPKVADKGPKVATAPHFSQVLNSQSALIYPTSAHLLAPNVTLMNFDNRMQQSSLFPSAPIPFFPGHSQPYSPFCGLSPAASTNHLSIPSNSACVNMASPTNFVSDDNSAVGIPTGNQAELQSQDALLSEIKRLRERLLTLETENASMSMKLNQQQWQVENREWSRVFVRSLLLML